MLRLLLILYKFKVKVFLENCLTGSREGGAEFFPEGGQVILLTTKIFPSPYLTHNYRSQLDESRCLDEKVDALQLIIDQRDHILNEKESELRIK